MKKKIITVILIIFLLVGCSLLLYPTVSNYWNTLHQANAIANYTANLDDLSEDEYNLIIKDAEQYNKSLLEKNNRWSLSKEETITYNNTLNPFDTGMMSYIEIPKIDITLPIYHGTTEGVLQTGIGHIEGTSLPIGGESTHCVLSSHRGLPSAKLFTDLDKLVVGDCFTIQVLNETLTYEVDQIHIVEPGDLTYLTIVDSEDLCTLVTCTPYGINTHRLLVRGHRIENPGGAAHISADAMRIDPTIIACIIATVILLFILIAVLIYTKKVKKDRRKYKKFLKINDNIKGGKI